MRKVLLFMMVTLDGFFEGPNKAINRLTEQGEGNEPI